MLKKELAEIRAQKLTSDTPGLSNARSSLIEEQVKCLVLYNLTNVLTFIPLFSTTQVLYVTEQITSVFVKGNPACILKGYLLSIGDIITESISALILECDGLIMYRQK